MPDLLTALDRLGSFRDGWREGDVIDEKSGLTADDIDLILDRAQRNGTMQASSARPDEQGWNSPIND